MRYRKNPKESYWKELEARANKAIREKHLAEILQSPKEPILYPKRDSKGRFLPKIKKP